MTDLHQKPARLIFSLADVCEKTSMSTDEILQSAALGEISFFTKVFPEIGKIESVNVFTLDIPERKSIVGSPIVQDVKFVHPYHFEHGKTLPIVDGVYLSALDCLEILHQGSIWQIVFQKGILFKGLSESHIVYPRSRRPSDYDGNREGLKDWYFATFPSNPAYKDVRVDFASQHFISIKQPCHLEISSNCLFVTSTELQKFQNDLLKPPTRPEPNDEFISHKNKAQMLVALDQAAFELFGNNKPDVQRKYNSIKAIKTYLIDKHSFSASVAPAAAKIIMPDPNHGDAYRTEGLMKLIKAWTHFYKLAVLNEVDTFRSKEEIARWLANEFEIPFDVEGKKSLPMKLSSIIRPENAKLGTRTPNAK